MLRSRTAASREKTPEKSFSMRPGARSVLEVPVEPWASDTQSGQQYRLPVDGIVFQGTCDAQHHQKDPLFSCLTSGCAHVI